MSAALNLRPGDYSQLTITQDFVENRAKTMAKKKLLLLEDDLFTSDILSQALSDEFEIIHTDDTDVAFRIATKNSPDIMLFDVHLKTGNGIELCKKVRENPISRKIPILIFTGQSNTEKMLRSFDVGADDFIEKPIDVEVLRKRLHARLRRVKDFAGDEQSFEDLKIFPDRQEMEVNGKVHKLSETEFSLLQIFITSPNKKIQRDEILKAIWKDVQVTERTIDVHICSLRRKLKESNYNIKALYGSGYIFRAFGKSKQREIT